MVTEEIRPRTQVEPDERTDDKGKILPAKPRSKIDWISPPDVAYLRFSSIINRSEVVHVRLARQKNMTSVLLTFKQYHSASEQELYHGYSVLIDNTSSDSPANIYTCPPYMSHRSEFIAFNDDGSMIATMEEGKNGHSLGVGLVGQGLILGMNFKGNTAISKIYKPLDEFGAFEWSPDGRYLLVLVRPGQASAPPVPAATPDQILGNKQFSDRTGPGEGLSDIDDFKAAIVELQTALLYCVDIPRDVFPSQFTWGKDNCSFYFVGTIVDSAYSLGLRYCTNRPSTIYQAKCTDPSSLKGPWKVSAFVNDMAAGSALHSPRVSPDGKHLVFTKNSIFGPHNHCRSVWIIDTKDSSRNEQLLVDQVRDRGTLSHLSYLPALYVGLYEDLPERCWTGDSKSIIFSASAGFRRHMYILFTDPKTTLTRRMYQIKPPTRQRANDVGPAGNGCWTVKTVYDDRFVSVYSSCSTCCEIYLGVMHYSEVVAGGCPVTFSWLMFVERKPYFDDIPLVGTLLSQKIPQPHLESADCFDTNGMIEESFLISVKNRHSDAPTLVCVHGGPNSAFHDEFSDYHYTTYAFAACGFNVLELNYVGSTGYGQKSLEYLTGHVTERDIDSCVRLLLTAIRKHRLNKNMLLYYGGSHAGAIGLHMMAKHPDLFVAAALRNPVCDYVSMLVSSDIPDYVFSQVLGRNFQKDFTFDGDTIQELLSKSPTASVAALKTPLLLLLGSQDLRVPCHAAIRLKQMLQARNVPCESRIYPQGHAIKEARYVQDAFVHCYNWFVKYLEQTLQSSPTVD